MNRECGGGGWEGVNLSIFFTEWCHAFNSHLRELTCFRLKAQLEVTGYLEIYLVLFGLCRCNSKQRSKPISDVEI